MGYLELKLVAIAFTLLFLNACSDNTQVPKGRYQFQANTKISLEFIKPDVVVITGPKMEFTSETSFAGTWKIIEGERIKIEFTGFAANMGMQICGLSFVGRDLILKDCRIAGTYTEI